MLHRNRIILLPPNRVWRTYQGGRVLDSLAGITAPGDSHFPEDWIGSVTRAVNPGRECIDEGISHVLIDNAIFDLKKLIAEDPEYFLGAAHLSHFGADPKVLVKFIDSAIRLHFQVHPTSDFARRFLNAKSGKTEAYHVLATRPETDEPCFYLGFRRPPSVSDLKRMIEIQDIPAIKECMNKVCVKPGDTYLVPGGTPHALGAGLFLVEIQEPSDLVVRFEFERGGYLLPESARFIGRELDFCLDVFDFSPCSSEVLEARHRKYPRIVRRFSAVSYQEELIGSYSTPSFRLTRSRFGDVMEKKESDFTICIVTGGKGTIAVNKELISVNLYEKFLLPAGLGPVVYAPTGREALNILECHPPAAE